jgi:hypothetical protein
MKHLVTFMSVCLLFATVSLAQEQDSTASAPRIQEAVVMTGVAFPYLPLDFRHHSMNGFDVGAGYSIRLTPGSLGYSTLSMVAEYSVFRFDGTQFANDLDSATRANNPGLTVTQRPVKAFSLMFNYKGNFTGISNSFSPYFLLGVGYVYYSVPLTSASTDTSLNVASSELSTIGWSFGLGIDVPINDDATIFAQAQSVLAALERPRQTFPIVIGLRYRL